MGERKRNNVNGCQIFHTKSKDSVNNDEEAGASNQGDHKESNSAALNPSRK